MNVESMTIGQAVSQVLAAKQANVATEAQVRVLDKSLETAEAEAAALLRLMGVGQNLDVVA
jgi:hypothetical protein